MGDYGLNQTFEYTELCLDSWDSGSAGGQLFEGSDSNPNLIQYSWPQYFFTSRQLRVAGIKVVQAEIPFVFDIVNTRNNTFQFTVAGTPTTVTIPTGTYTGPTLAAQLQTLLTPLAVMLVTWSSTTLRFTFTYGGAPATWGFIFPVGRLSSFQLMGFLPNTTTTMFGVGSIISPTVASVTGPYYLYVNSNKLGSLVNFNLPDQSLGTGTEICRIPVNVNFGSVIFFNDPNSEYFYDFFINQQFQSFDFYLTLGSDQYQKPLDMKGVSWSLKLGILSYRKATTDLYQKPNQSVSRGKIVIGL